MRIKPNTAPSSALSESLHSNLSENALQASNAKTMHLYLPSALKELFSAQMSDNGNSVPPHHAALLAMMLSKMSSNEDKPDISRDTSDTVAFKRKGAPKSPSGAAKNSKTLAPREVNNMKVENTAPEVPVKSNHFQSAPNSPPMAEKLQKSTKRVSFSPAPQQSVSRSKSPHHRTKSPHKRCSRSRSRSPSRQKSASTTPRTIWVPDTCVLSDERLVNGLKSAIANKNILTTTNHLGFSYAVINELDPLKNGNTIECRSVRKIMRLVDSLHNDPAFYQERKKDFDWRGEFLNEHLNDSRIIRFCDALKDYHGYDRVILCSNDVNLRNRARTFDIECHSSQESLKMWGEDGEQQE